MAAPYTASGNPIADSAGSSSLMRAEFVLVQAGFTTLSTEFFLVVFDDFNTAGSRSFVAPFAGTIEKVDWVIDAGNSGADTDVTLEIQGNLVGFPGDLTQAAADTAGNVETVNPNSTRTVAVGDRVEVLTDGVGSGVMPGSVMVHILRV